MNKQRQLRIRNILANAGLVMILFALAACSGEDASENTSAVNTVNSTQPVTTETAPAVNTVPEYPVSQLPEGMVWETNDEDPVYADPEAIPGGTFRGYMPSFPLTLRLYGPDSNSGFAYYLRANHLSMVDFHPETRNFLPSLATHWAYGEDKKTLYFKLDPDARWSDGKPITADDYMFTLDFMRSEYIVDPFSNNYFTKEIVAVNKYDDYTISVTGGTAKPKEDLLLYYTISPTPRHFHKLDEKWVQDFNWLIEPVTGPYQISTVEKGKYIEFTRNRNWWANDRKYNNHRFNVDKIRLTVIREPEIAYRHFLLGELDSAGLTAPNYWHDKTGDAVFQDGYISKIWFYNDLPQPKYGIYLNMDNDLFKDSDVRLGFSHAMNIQKMIDTVLRGDYQRQHTYHTGYGEYSNMDIRARDFDLDKAEEYFKKAGWAERGSDGIRIKDGNRMSVVLTYSTQLHTDRLVVLREEAKKAGVDLQLNLLDSATAFKSMLEKKHQAAWMGWAASLRPEYWEHFHSDNAHKPQTNNITNTDDPDMDSMITRYNDSYDVSERVQSARDIQLKIHAMGAFIPTYYVPYVREGYWKWMKLPKGHGTRMSDVLFDPVGLSLFWIDEEEKVRTLAAMKAGEKFEPVTIIDETYKVKY